MRLTVNGKTKEYSGPATLADLIKKFCPAPERVIAELNGQIVKSPLWPQTTLKDQDQLELVALVGGG